VPASSDIIEVAFSEQFDKAVKSALRVADVLIRRAVRERKRICQGKTPGYVSARIMHVAALTRFIIAAGMTISVILVICAAVGIIAPTARFFLSHTVFTGLRRFGKAPCKDDQYEKERH
jgi:hypothetical protein